MGIDRWFSLKGKVAVVTGAGRGLGRGYAEALSEAGAHVICADVDAGRAEAAAQAVSVAGYSAEAQAVDVSDVRAIREAMNEIVARRGHLDILVNNAGIEIAENIDAVVEDHYDAIMAVNLRGLFFTAQAAAGHMVSQGAGKIINIGSLGSAIGLPGSTVYCAAKGGVLQFTRALAVELAGKGVQVNAIGPGYFRTEMTEPFFQDPEHRKWIENRIPVGRDVTAADLAATVVFLSSAGSDYLTGQIVYVDGGWLAS
jgi:NAD(P)-dependent dehydrogenase (short-subunit alcohol dehydrogenase family)